MKSRSQHKYGLTLNEPNFSTQAIEALHEQALMLAYDMPRTAKNIERVVQLLWQSVKFYLPDNGDLFEDGLRALPAIFRLPYPVIAAEFRITKDAPEQQQPLAIRGEQVYTSTKRIALAIEITSENFDEFSWMLPREKYELLTLDGAIAIIPVCYIDSTSEWVVPPYGIVIPSRKSMGTPSMAAITADVWGGVPKGMKRLPIEMHPTFLKPEHTRQLEASNDTNYILSIVAQDNHDEGRAILNLIEILSCRNVVTETIPASISLNNKRKAKGKTPFFEYKVLMLNVPDEHSSNACGSGGTHASPRVHLRRGHIRRLPNKVIWVNASVVGNRTSGIIEKDDSVSGP